MPEVYRRGAKIASPGGTGPHAPPLAYPRRTVRLIEIRLLEGPNVYRLMPVVKVEVAVGRTKAWQGSRTPSDGVVHLGRKVPASEWPDAVADLVAWTRRLRADHGEHGGPCEVHRSSDAGHWIVAWPWSGAERARLIAEAAYDLSTRSVSAARRARLTGAQAQPLARWQARIAEARATPPSWIRDDARRMPAVSVTGTNGKSTVTRLITHILLRAGRHVGTTTSDGILVDERMIDPGDWTGPGGAQVILRRNDVDVAVLETARGGLVLRGMGYESNDASVFTNVSSDHLDLQGIHTLAELAEVKSTICRVTKPDGWVVLNADDPLVAAVARRVRARVALVLPRSGRARPSSRGTGGPAAFVPTCSGAGCSSSGTATRSTRSSRRPTCPSRSAAWHATTWPTPWPRPAARARWGCRSPRSPTACATSGRRPSSRPAA